jgi:hypothetical protein
MAWKQGSSRQDKQGGKWDNYYDEETGEKIQTRTDKNGNVAIFKNGKKVNKKRK